MKKQEPKIGIAKITAESIAAAHLEALKRDIPQVSLATLLAGEVAVVTIQSIEGIVAEFTDFVENSGISRNYKYVIKGLLTQFMLQKAKQDGVIYIKRPHQK